MSLCSRQHNYSQGLCSRQHNYGQGAQGLDFDIGEPKLNLLHSDDFDTQRQVMEAVSSLQMTILSEMKEMHLQLLKKQDLLSQQIKEQREILVASSMCMAPAGCTTGTAWLQASTPQCALTVPNSKEERESPSPPQGTGIVKDGHKSKEPANSGPNEDATDANESDIASDRDEKDEGSKKKLKTGAFGALNSKEEQALDEHAYNVESLYKKTGLPQLIARSEWFHVLTLAIISINALYIGIEVEMNDPDQSETARWVWFICDQFFCIFFVFELLMRFLSFARPLDCLKDGWFKFDLFLVLLMIFETWLLPLALLLLNMSGGVPIGPMKLLRLLRLARMTRLMSRMPELLTMVKGMSMASRAVGSSLLLLALFIYVFAILLYTILPENAATSSSFGSLPKCMWTLLMDGTFLDSIGDQLTGLLNLQEYPAVIVFMLFVGLSAMTVMNMLIGVLCEVVSAVAAAEREEAAIALMKETILVFLKRADEDGSGGISKDELRVLVSDPGAISVLEELQVNISYLMDMHDHMMDGRSSQLAIKEIMDLILTSRGERAITMRDLVDAQMFTAWQVHRFLDHRFNELSNQIHRLSSARMLGPRAPLCL